MRGFAPLGQKPGISRAKAVVPSGSIYRRPAERSVPPKRQSGCAIARTQQAKSAEIKAWLASGPKPGEK
jgi:hypothetical protein